MRPEALLKLGALRCVHAVFVQFERMLGPLAEREADLITYELGQVQELLRADASRHGALRDGISCGALRRRTRRRLQRRTLAMISSKRS